MTLLFENEVCGRCAGSGQYSYNQIDGSRCYGCSGRKLRLTKRGAAAQRFFDTFKEKPIMELKVGDVVEVYGTTYRYFAPIVSLDLEPKEGGYSTTRSGDKVPLFFVSFETLSERFGKGGLRAPPSSTVKIKLAGADRELAVEKALAYQSTLTKSGQPKKGKS